MVLKIICLSILSDVASSSLFIPAVDRIWSTSIDVRGFFGELESPVYSVLTDPRSKNWTTTIPVSVTAKQLNKFLPFRIPLVKVIVCVDLSDPVDLDNIQALLYAPKPIDMHIVPVVVPGSHANAILTRCYSTVVHDEQRVKDFITALADLASIRKLGGGYPVKPRSAILACRLFTQDLAGVNEWVDSTDWPDWLLPVSDLKPHTVIMNSERFEDVSLENLGTILLQSQFEAFQKIVVPHGEL